MTLLLRHFKLSYNKTRLVVVRLWDTMTNNKDDDFIDPLDFTLVSENKFYDVVDIPDFKENDSETIFKYLSDSIRLVSFGDYLKRYIFKKAAMCGEYDKIDLVVYQNYITVSFNENETPKSFTDTTTKLSALAKNWLTQSSVNRSVVFLLGFGLRMSQLEVSAFLTKALCERDFNFKDPIEVIYWYCFKNNYKYSQMLKIQEKYLNMPSKKPNDYSYMDATVEIKDSLINLNEEELLLESLVNLKDSIHKSLFSSTSEKWFLALYNECKRIIASFYTADELEEGNTKVWNIDEISEGDVEKVLCCGIPINLTGNLQKISSSKFASYFSSKRLSRQHLYELLNHLTPIDRFDLITLNFFIYANKDEYLDDNKNRYIAFVDSTNAILEECSMGELYFVNPYESFLLMCILADAPFSTFADVWEMSFNE